MQKLFIFIILVISGCLSPVFSQGADVFIDQVSISDTQAQDPELELDRDEAEKHLFDLFESDSAVRKRLKTFLSGPSDTGSFGAIVQRGSTNRSTIIQRGAGNIGLALQAGNGNAIDLLQQGSRNLNYILQQGNDNIFDASIIGDDNILGVEQLGNNNIYEMDFQQGSNAPLQHQVLQEGNNLSLSQTGISTTGPASVIQRGEGMGLRIEHNQ